MTRAALLLLSLLVLPSVARAQYRPPDEATFAYHLHRDVHGGAFAYEGYADSLVASGRYRVTSTATFATLYAEYHWRYDSSERHESGEELRQVDVDLPSRLYSEGQTDLDEYDDQVASRLTTWVFVPTGLADGDHVSILDRDFTVVSTTEQVTIADAPRVAILLRGTGEGTRNDDYGEFTTTFVDTYWFDAATGMFLREEYTEHDDGTYEGARAAFDVTERTYVVDASYAPASGPVPPDPVTAGGDVDVSVPRGLRPFMLIAVGLAVLAVGALLYFVFSRAGANRPTVDGKPIEVTKLARAAPLPALPSATSIAFAPFFAHFADVARRTNNDVVVARVGGQPVAIAFGDRDAAVGSIFAPDADVCELVRKELGVTEFFSELRHGNLESVKDATTTTGTSLTSSHAYNVYETYEVLRLDAIPAVLSFDSSVVSRLKDADAAEAITLLEQTLGVPCAAFVRASLAIGDVGYVAKVDNRIVGVGLASLAGTTGRLHTLAVHPDHRAKGLGKELVRARLRALSELGATTVIAEIATWNLASLEIARAHGFKKTSDVYVESSRDQKVEKRLVRR